MAITNKSTTTPTFLPVYNPVVYYFDSTNKNQTGFRYVIDLYYYGTTNKIAEYRVAPRPIDGYGYIDLSKILSNIVSYDFYPTLITPANNAPNSSIRYDLKIGEEYIINYTLSTFTNNSGFTRVTTTAANTFVLGDQVSITETNIPLSGLFTITNIVSSTVFDIDLIWDASYSVTLSGNVSYADNRKTIIRDLLSYNNNTAFNGVESFSDFISYTDTKYKSISILTKSYIMTSIPLSGFYATLDQDLWLNVGNYYSTTSYYMYFTNSNGDIFRKQINDVTQAIRTVAVGPNNFGSLSLVSGTAGLIKTDTTFYTIEVRDISGNIVTYSYTINLDKRCKIEDYEICYLDKLGSFISYSFSLRSKKNININRDVYVNQAGDLIGTKFNYYSYTRTSTPNNVDYTESLELNTDFFLSDEMSILYQTLITSPMTFIKINGLYYQCVVNDTNYTEERFKNKKLIRKTITVNLVNQINNF